MTARELTGLASWLIDAKSSELPHLTSWRVGEWASHYGTIVLWNYRTIVLWNYRTIVLWGDGRMGRWGDGAMGSGVFLTQQKDAPSFNHTMAVDAFVEIPKKMLDSSRRSSQRAAQDFHHRVPALSDIGQGGQFFWPLDKCIYNASSSSSEVTQRSLSESVA